MRTEKEVRGLLSYVEMLCPELNTDPVNLLMNVQVDTLKWVLGEPSPLDRGIVELRKDVAEYRAKANN